ncbi:MAG TPA: glycosyltransferase, partial [Candidatus Dormibacteraeota bacterium]
MIAAVIVVGGILAVSSLALFLFGANLLYLSWRSIRVKAVQPREVEAGAEPPVCVQIPIYNERYVAERVIDAVARLDWPRERLEIQALDDSDDMTVDIVAEAVRRWAAEGLRISHVRRDSRDGYKAGALAHGLQLTEAPFIAIFDADFVPPPEFLRRLVGAFEDDRVGFVQARWGHLNESYSWFTRLQALAIDFHFLVEQAVRSGSGWFTNFTGTAGIWRKAAIEAAGGWSARTLTEDLDLSYRAQLAGWRPVFVEGVVVPEELPVSIDAYRSQQARWATGSFQSAFKLLPQVMRSPASGGAKAQAFAHLLAYGVGPAMLLQLACYPAILAGRLLGPPWLAATTPPAWLSLISLAPWLGFLVAQWRRGRGWPAGLPAIACQLIGAAMSLTVMLSFARAMRPGGEFVRTPKHKIVRAGQNWQDKDYVRVGDPRVLAELAIGAAALPLVPAGLALGAPLVAIYSAMFAAGFLGIGLVSAYQTAQVVAFRRLGFGAWRSLQAAAPTLGLLAAAGALLLAFTRLPEPFEDSYQHWLMAAYLAATGHLRDPIFSMQDTWLPGYQVVAAAVLKAFGLWRLDLLKVLNALFALGTLLCVSRLAPNRRQGRIAV